MEQFPPPANNNDVVIKPTNHDVEQSLMSTKIKRYKEPLKANDNSHYENLSNQ